MKYFFPLDAFSGIKSKFAPEKRMFRHRNTGEKFLPRPRGLAHSWKSPLHRAVFVASGIPSENVTSLKRGQTMVIIQRRTVVCKNDRKYRGWCDDTPHISCAFVDAWTWRFPGPSSGATLAASQTYPRKFSRTNWRGQTTKEESLALGRKQGWFFDFSGSS